ncbi:MAG: lactate dehydrogenase [Betaproteobacteria bacterium]|nr:lactate dehydrogenase [Betaproteobacteria bacterium]
MRQPKIVIVGAGLVGGSAALFCALALPSARIVLIDVEKVRAEGQTLDLAHAAAFWGHDRFVAGEDEDARDADIIVITAGAGVKPGQTRLDLIEINSKIVGGIVDRLAPLAPEAIYIVAANPCDILAHVAYVRSGVSRERVISTGTSLDTARLRTLLADRLNVVAPAIHAYVVGEHGESALIHWSGATVADMPLEIFLTRTGKEMGAASRDLILRSVHESAKQIKEGKGATHYGIASAVGRICHAIVTDSNLILSVGVVQAEVEGVADVCVSLPMSINGAGAHLLAYPEFDVTEREALQRSAGIVKAATATALKSL